MRAEIAKVLDVRAKREHVLGQMTVSSKLIHQRIKGYCPEVSARAGPLHDVAQHRFERSPQTNQGHLGIHLSDVCSPSDGVPDLPKGFRQSIRASKQRLYVHTASQTPVWRVLATR